MDPMRNPLAWSLVEKPTKEGRFHMANDEKSTGKDTNGQGASKPSNGQSQGRTPQGGGQGNAGDGKSGGRDSSQPGGQND
jgi:hypothetical protein